MSQIVSAFARAVLLAACVASGSALAQTAADVPSRPLVVMNLAAHPDDEDGLTMAYYRGHEDAVVYSVVYTRGEGGQNEIGPDLYERLGAIRTGETEAAARVLGTQVFFLNRYDFGFSKHAEEAFAEWSRPRTGFWDNEIERQDAAAGREYLTADLVRLVRRLKPDVMFTNHDTTTAWPDAQHGQHQAVGITAYDAFVLAADPTYRPEQLEEPGVDPWQPKRLFVRVGGFSEGEPEHYDVAVPVGETCAPTAVRPAEACADRAVAAAALHASQGFDTFAPRFRRDTTYFQLYRQSAEAPPLPEGAADLAAGLAPNPAADGLDVATLIDSGRLPTLDGLTVSSATVVPSQAVYVRWPSGSARRTLTVLPPPGAPTRGLDAAQPVTVPLSEGSARVVVPSGTRPTAPAYRAQYDRWESEAPFVYVVREGDEIVAGGRLPVQIVPPATVDLSAAPIRLVPGVNEIPVELAVFDVRRDTVTVGVTVYDSDRPVALAVEGVAAADSGATFRLDVGDLPPGRYRVVADARTIGCGLPWYRVSRPAAVLPDVAVAPGLRVGFVRSYDGTMAAALEVMGADVVDLDSTALATGDFDGLHTIVVDIRALLDRPDLVAHKQPLIDWVEQGGHLVVGYHKSFEWNAEDGLAPYPLVLGRDRVTYEDAPVTVLQPEHPLFHAPHEITPADWDGWVQERGLYFPSDVDDRYTALLAVGDPGEAPLQTGLLVASAGAGTYVYSPLVWYRQLDALNPGAWRLFANLVSLPLTDGRGEALGSR